MHGIMNKENQTEDQTLGVEKKTELLQSITGEQIIALHNLEVGLADFMSTMVNNCNSVSGANENSFAKSFWPAVEQATLEKQSEAWTPAKIQLQNHLKQIKTTLQEGLMKTEFLIAEYEVTIARLESICYQFEIEETEYEQSP